jgi:hypothetical protein
MAVVRQFPVILFPSQLITIARALGCHVACKLESFASDERTLTDDLCDMFLIWSNEPIPPPPQEQPIGVILTKSTQEEESRYGFDLEIRVLSPKGQKKALLQAKVLDPQSKQLRIAGARGRRKLRRQLLNMKAQAPGMYFLLIYVPASDLNGEAHGSYGTWEQGYYQTPPASLIARALGTTLISGDQLLIGNRQRLKSIVRINPGIFAPAGMSIAKLFVDLMVCDLGNWTTPDPIDFESRSNLRGPKVSFTFDFASKSTPNEWDSFVDGLRAASKGLH